MDITHDNNFSEEEVQTLQEIMNIAFGKASADLASVIDIYVVLNVPYIKVLQTEGLTNYIANEIKGYDFISIVEQKFWGEFKGIALLIFPAEGSKELISLLDQKETALEDSDMAILEKETLMEVGNIIIGACVGKLAELLEDVVTYSPPRVIIKNYPKESIAKNLFSPDSLAIVMKTVFSFKERDVNGFLFLTASHETFNWLKSALHKFLEQYE